MKQFTKILVIRFSSIGDIVLTTSCLKSIKKKYNNPEIHFLTLDRFSSILEMQPDIDRIIELNSSIGFKGLIELNGYIKSSQYDKIFDLHGSIRSRIVTLGLNNITSKVKKPRLLRLFLFQLHINLFPKGYSTSVMYHECIDDHDTLSIPKTELIVSNIEKKSVMSILKDNGVKDKFIVIVPGAAWPQKQWSINKYSEVIDEVLKRIKQPVVMLGTLNDKICKEISLINNNVIDLSGKTDIRQSMAIISLSNTVFGSDTGLLHIAEALNRRVTMILGPTSTETGGGVSLNESKNIEIDLWCRPCSQNGKYECSRPTQYCMELISSDRVLSSILERA
tara:strand:+ start:518 stop:1525 length:1008 start_codon:yes stop_codon:yes gene_type:complete